MAKKLYVGNGNIARNVKSIYIGVNGVARKVKKGYIGVNGIARQFYSSGIDLNNATIQYIQYPGVGTAYRYFTAHKLNSRYVAMPNYMYSDDVSEDYTTLISSNGVNWESLNKEPSYLYIACYEPAILNGTLCCVQYAPYDTYSDQHVYTTTDGVNFVDRGIPNTSRGKAYTLFGPVAGNGVCVMYGSIKIGSYAKVYSAIFRTSDFVNYDIITSYDSTLSTSFNIWSLGYANVTTAFTFNSYYNKFYNFFTDVYTSSLNFSVYSSSDGFSWNQIYNGTLSSDLSLSLMSKNYRLISTDNQALVLSSNPEFSISDFSNFKTIMSLDGGYSWQTVTFPYRPTDIKYVMGTYVAVGTDCSMLYSCCVTMY